MRKAKGHTIPLEKMRSATAEALQPLTERGNIFFGAKPQTLERVVQNGVIRSLEKGEVIFEQGQRTDNLPFFCVLSGRFDIIHIWGSNHRHVATQGAGALIGDVELLLRGETLDQDEITIRGLSTDQTWAKVVCAAPGDVLSIWPADFLLEADPMLAVTFARSLAKKLLLRSAIADPKAIFSKPKQVELYLRRVARDLVEGCADTGDLIPIPMSLADVAAEVDCAKQTVAVALRDLAAKYAGFSHERSLIVVPRRFIEGSVTELFE